MSGQEVLRTIKNSPVHRDIPIVMMTGLSDEDQMRCAARNGANSYTLKPTDAQQLLADGFGQHELLDADSPAPQPAARGGSVRVVGVVTAGQDARSFGMRDRIL